MILSPRPHPLTALARVALVLALALPACVRAEKPLVYCSDASPEGFDPALWDTVSTSNVNSQMFQGLLAFRRGGTELVPLLATDWDVSADARVFTFHLRRGVHFHTTPYFRPTRDFDADDVLFTFGRFLDPDLPFNRAFPTTFVYPENLGLAKTIEGLDRLDDHTVRFRLKEPNVTFLSDFAMSFAAIHSAEYAAQLLRDGRAAEINNYPVGTGPYRFRSYAKDDVVRMEANPDYWGPKQRTQALIFSIAREPNVRIQKLLANECQVSASLRDIDLRALDGRPHVVVLKKLGLNISYLSFNMGKAPTSNRDVREALDIAVDRKAIFRTLFPRGDAVEAVSAFPPTIVGFDSTLRNDFDPARARQLLARAGYPNGLDIDLWALPVARPTNPNGQLMAQIIQQDWARIGVRAHIKTYEWGEYLKRANRGEHDVYMSGWSGENGDADDFLTPNLSCAANRSGVKFCNKEFDALIDAARATTDTARRVALYHQAQQIFKHERPWIPIAHATIYMAIRDDVHGFVMTPNGAVDFEDVYRQ